MKFLFSLLLCLPVISFAKDQRKPTNFQSAVVDQSGVLCKRVDSDQSAAAALNEVLLKEGDIQLPTLSKGPYHFARPYSVSSPVSYFESHGKGRNRVRKQVLCVTITKR